MSDNDLNNFGTIIPSKVIKVNIKTNELKDKLVVFQPKNITYKGIVKWYGQINDNDAYGIETDPIEFGTKGEFNGHNIFSSKSECGVLIKDNGKLLEVNEQCGSICKSHCEDFKDDYQTEYSDTDFVVVRFVNALKIGKILNYGEINGIFCYKLKTIEDSQIYVFIKNDVLGKFANNDGIVKSFNDGIFDAIKSPEVFKAEIGQKIRFKCNNKYETGVLKWKGKIDNLKCIGILPDSADLTNDFRKQFPNENDTFWTLICLDMLGADKSLLYEISDPNICKIFNYFKISAFVNILNTKESYETVDGTVEAYLTDGREFFYEVKVHGNEIIIAKYDDVKCGFTGLSQQGNKAFKEITDPNSFGIITQLKKDDNVKIYPDDKNKLVSVCDGVLCWMGFDKDSSLKYFLRLNEPNEHGNNGLVFGQKIAEVANKCGLLVEPKCVVPVELKNKENQTYKSSEIVEEYQMPRSKISCGIERGIQGDKNSCYMDTSFFAMFAFQEIFDSLFLKGDHNSEIRNIMRSRIVYPLRKYEYVSFNRVSEFRKELGNLFPGKNFLHSEKDPEELLETLFHLLTPKDPLLKTFNIDNGVKQSCFMTQLFYMNEPSTSKISKISEMLQKTFLQGGFLINKPPKCLILQLPRHGTHYKQFSEVLIEPKIDISHLIRYGKNKCSECSTISNHICLACHKNKFAYYCSNHLSNCKHKKFSLKVKRKENIFEGKVELELFAILCIEKTHYVAYVKTGEVLGKWIYYDSMAKTDQSVLKPEIRETDIGKYFMSNKEDDLDSEHVTRIKKFAFVCFYKNPTLEYYSQDFNHVNK